MRTIAVLIAAICSACVRDERDAAASATLTQATLDAGADAFVWKPHKVQPLHAIGVCRELIEAGVAERCIGDDGDGGGGGVVLFTVVGQPRENRGTLLMFSSREVLARWITAPEARSKPIYHSTNTQPVVAVSFTGTVPSDVKMKVVEVLDAL